jgi:glycine cleavage system aminomethyltransferase T
MSETLRKQYEKAQHLGKLAFVERPYFGSPGAPAQAETNASQIWGHINAGYLIAYEYTRWWKESLALRNAAVIGDWSWLNKTRVTGRDAARFMNYATVKDLSKQSVGQIMYTPMCSAEGKVAIGSLAFARDGKSIYLTADAVGEFRRLGIFDLQTQQYRWLTEDIQWDVSDVEVDPETGAVAFAINEDGASRVFFVQPGHRRRVGQTGSV